MGNLASKIGGPKKQQTDVPAGARVPVSVLTDSYKAGHFMMYPEAQKMVAYGEFRRSYNKDPNDTRFVFYGIRYIIDNYVSRKWTMEDVSMAKAFYSTHNAPLGTEYPFPEDLFTKFVKAGGYFPVRIEALPEGTCANVHVPVYQIFAEEEYSRLVTFLETILTQLWYPSNVATLSRRTRDLVEDAFERSCCDVDFLIPSRLHDFGFRGASCVEASIIGGCGHLLNFTGSDTMSAAFYAQYTLNEGVPVAASIPATEHSVMTAWKNETAAIRNMIQKFGGENKIFACVMDSYDYDNALNKILPALAEEHKKKGGLMVMRPDSGDPTKCILDALVAGEKAMGATTNAKGFKILNGLAAIQGDGINYDNVAEILKAVMDAGYAAQNVAFGMGAGLLQKHNRDTMSFATKLCFIKYMDGEERLVMKKPKTDNGKTSFPGILKVKRVDGNLMIFPRENDEKADKDNELEVVYDHGPVKGHTWSTFDEIRERIKDQWHKCPKTFDPVSEEIKKKMEDWVKDYDANYGKMLEVEAAREEEDEEKGEEKAEEEDEAKGEEKAEEEDEAKGEEKAEEEDEAKGEEKAEEEDEKKGEEKAEE